MKKELSNFKAWVGYQLTYISDVVSFYYVTHETTLARGEKILKYQIFHKNQPEAQVYQNRINLIEDKMTRLENYDKYKKVFFGACLIFICTLCFTIITKPLALLSLIFSYIALISLLCILPFSFLIFFDKAKLKRNLETYKSNLDLQIESSICIESEVEIKPEIKIKTETINSGSHCQKITFNSLAEIAVLYYLFKVKKTSNIQSAPIFKEIAASIFLLENGDEVTFESLKNPCITTSQKSENWKILDLFISKLSKYNSYNQTSQIDLNPTIQTKLDYLKSKFQEKGITFPNEQRVDLMLKLYYHHTIEKHEEHLKLSDAELTQVKKLHLFLINKSKKEIEQRAKKSKSRNI